MTDSSHLDSALSGRLVIMPAGGGYPGPRPLVLVLPGGAYVGQADHEAEPVGEWLNGLGFHAAVLRYRVAPDRYPAALEDAVAAMTYLRSPAVVDDHDLHVDTEQVGVLGFSAGGHLAASLSNPVAYGKPADAKPDFAVLCYPVISLGRLGDGSSAANLLGPDPDPAVVRQQQVDRQVGSSTPPTFIWHTADDEAVPVGHALAYAEALSDHEVPFALHVFPHGVHGLGLAYEELEVGQWTDLCAAWFANQVGLVTP